VPSMLHPTRHNFVSCAAITSAIDTALESYTVVTVCCLGGQRSIPTRDLRILVTELS
jgi:hypothetical protein